MPEPYKSKYKVGLPLFRFSTLSRQDVIEKRLEQIKNWGFNAIEIHFLGNRLGSPDGNVPHYPLASRAEKIGKLLTKYAVSIHSPYEMSLTVTGKKQKANTKAHFTYNFKLGDLLGATHFTFHPGSLRGVTTYTNVKNLLNEIMEKARTRGFRCLPAPEVAGKIKAFGDFFQTVDLARDCGTLMCWDIAHDFARGGDVISEHGILQRLDYLEEHLDLKKYRLPVHLSGIKANRTGEVQHTLLGKGSGVPWRLVLSVIKE
ncbi:MAG: TIM barrel protein, partial [Candidatus Ranarchaeia archaeon]